jgi:hypothetical protein
MMELFAFETLIECTLIVHCVLCDILGYIERGFGGIMRHFVIFMRYCSVMLLLCVQWRLPNRGGRENREVIKKNKLCRVLAPVALGKEGEQRTLWMPSLPSALD